jgi:hypothetical protein
VAASACTVQASAAPLAAPAASCTSAGSAYAGVVSERVGNGFSYRVAHLRIVAAIGSVAAGRRRVHARDRGYRLLSRSTTGFVAQSA